MSLSLRKIRQNAISALNSLMRASLLLLLAASATVAAKNSPSSYLPSPPSTSFKAKVSSLGEWQVGKVFHMPHASSIL